jgi:hypothetical protein
VDLDRGIRAQRTARASALPGAIWITNPIAQDPRDTALGLRAHRLLHWHIDCSKRQFCNEAEWAFHQGKHAVALSARCRDDEAIACRQSQVGAGEPAERHAMCPSLLAVPPPIGVHDVVRRRPDRVATRADQDPRSTARHCPVRVCVRLRPKVHRALALLVR